MSSDAQRSCGLKHVDTATRSLVEHQNKMSLENTKNEACKLMLCQVEVRGEGGGVKRLKEVLQTALQELVSAADAHLRQILRYPLHL